MRDDEVLTRTGLVRSWRQCHKHPEEGLELAMLQRAGRHSVVWACAECDGVWHEQGAFRRRHPHVVYEASAGAKCPGCGSEALRSNDDVANAASCTGCGADVRVVLTRVAE